MDDWDRHLTELMDRTEHSTTGISPHMLLTGHEKTLLLTFFYPEYQGKKTASQMYIRDVIWSQPELNDLCRRNTQQAQIRQKRRFDKKKDCGGKSLLNRNVCLGVLGGGTNKAGKKLRKKWRFISQK